MNADNDIKAVTFRPIGKRITNLFAVLAMGSWVVVAAIPMVVAIVALT
jgi:hypothetical protein